MALVGSGPQSSSILQPLVSVRVYVGYACMCVQHGHVQRSGRLVVVDNDVVDTSNLHRQVIHTTANDGKPKALSARAAGMGVCHGLCVSAH